ncbi:hypothetical protein CISG_05477 [Coccidioides immitis RMSCC 3703]|uniref:Uncharacterized protein n=1 Tax=Coccidioides immitis RMSCC 3703 TaxID=454286 RepID=A0A0J8TQG6_COCIT|nr:hypothetical protein CISG_05477 [Coccidioides immitis RMSCC 3703]
MLKQTEWAQRQTGTLSVIKKACGSSTNKCLLLCNVVSPHHPPFTQSPSRTKTHCFIADAPLSPLALLPDNDPPLWLVNENRFGEYSVGLNRTISLRALIRPGCTSPQEKVPLQDLMLKKRRDQVRLLAPLPPTTDSTPQRFLKISRLTLPEIHPRSHLPR